MAPHCLQSSPLKSGPSFSSFNGYSKNSGFMEIPTTLPLPPPGICSLYSLSRVAPHPRRLFGTSGVSKSKACVAREMVYVGVGVCPRLRKAVAAQTVLTSTVCVRHSRIVLDFERSQAFPLHHHLIFRCWQLILTLKIIPCPKHGLL